VWKMAWARWIVGGSGFKVDKRWVRTTSLKGVERSQGENINIRFVDPFKNFRLWAFGKITGGGGENEEGVSRHGGLAENFSVPTP